MNKEKIKEFILKSYPELKDVDIIDDIFEIERITMDLNAEGLVNFQFYQRVDSSGEHWLQCEYYSKKLNKTIIWDYDADSYFDDESGDNKGDISAVECMVNILCKYQIKITNFEDMISITL